MLTKFTSCPKHEIEMIPVPVGRGKHKLQCKECEQEKFDSEYAANMAAVSEIESSNALQFVDFDECCETDDDEFNPEQIAEDEILDLLCGKAKSVSMRILGRVLLRL